MACVRASHLATTVPVGCYALFVHKSHKLLIVLPENVIRDGTLNKGFATTRITLRSSPKEKRSPAPRPGCAPFEQA